MSYFPCDIPYMSDEELERNGIKIDIDENDNIDVKENTKLSSCGSEYIRKEDVFLALKEVNDLYYLREGIYADAWSSAVGRIGIEVGLMPSIKPEPLTDDEQRIFLAAMGREEKICKDIDEEYKDFGAVNLVSVCRKIVRKVKGALWT